MSTVLVLGLLWSEPNNIIGYELYIYSSTGRTNTLSISPMMDTTVGPVKGNHPEYRVQSTELDTYQTWSRCNFISKIDVFRASKYNLQVLQIEVQKSSKGAIITMRTFKKRSAALILVGSCQAMHQQSAFRVPNLRELPLF